MKKKINKNNIVEPMSDQEHALKWQMDYMQSQSKIAAVMGRNIHPRKFANEAARAYGKLSKKDIKNRVGYYK